MTELHAVTEKSIVINNFEIIHYGLSDGTFVVSHSRILNLVGGNIYSNDLHKQLSQLRRYLPFLFLTRKVKNGVLFKVGVHAVRGITSDDLEILFRGMLKARKNNSLPYKLTLIAGLANVYFINQRSQEMVLKDKNKTAPQHMDPLAGLLRSSFSTCDTDLQIVHASYL